MKKATLFFSLILICMTTFVYGQEEKPESRFSHKGIKIAFGGGGYENNFDEFGGKIEEGGAGSFALGWGIDDHFTLWLAGYGGEYPGAPVNNRNGGFGGGEINLQYKFLTDSRIQPYGKVGIGIHAIGQTGVTFVGTGFSAALGADYFFSRHVGVGVELQFKELDYGTRIDDVGGKDIETKLNPKLDGKTSGIMFSLIIQ